MVVNGLGKLVRQYPHVPGIDFAGTVESSDSDAFKAGDRVVLTGWRVGEVHWGGYAGKARVKSDRSEEHTSELPSLMRNSYSVFCFQKNYHLSTHLLPPHTTIFS